MSARHLFASIAAVTVALLAVVATGCGGTASADSTGAPAEVAKLIPASSPLYVELDTNIDDVQWSHAMALAERFPAYDELEAEFNKELAEAKLDFETDIRPLLGGRAALAAGEVEVPENLPNADPGDLLDNTGFLAVLQLEEGKDATVLELITRDGDLTKRGEHNGVDYYADDDDTFGAIADGFLVIADGEDNLFAALDRIDGSGDALSDVDKFKDALDGLEEGAIARMYLDIGRLAQDSISSVDQVDDLGLGIQDLENAAMGAVLLTEDNGLRLKGSVIGADSALTEAASEFSPALASQLPADAVAYVGFADLAGQLGAVIQQLESAEGGEDIGEQLSQAAGQLDAFLGVSVEDLSALASGEHAFAVTNDEGKVGVAGILEVGDGDRAEATLDSLRQALPGLAGLAGGNTTVPAFRPAPLANGVSGWELPLDSDFSLVYAVDGDRVLLGSSVGVVRELQQPGSPLASDPGFVTDTTGIPEQVTSLLWVDIQDALGLALELGEPSAEDRANLAQIEPLKSIAAWSTGGSEPGFEMFARIE